MSDDKSIRKNQEPDLTDDEVAEFVMRANAKEQAVPIYLAGVISGALRRGIDAVIGDRDTRRVDSPH